MHVRFVIALALLTAMVGSPGGATASGANGRIAYVTGCCDQYELWTTGFDLVTLHQLTDPFDLEFVGAPSWSPDGRIVFTAKVFDSPVRESTDLWIINGDGGGLTRLVQTGPWESTASWSPDGARIAFMRRGDLFLIDADGTDRVRLTETRRYEWSPEWSPDGATLSFLMDTKVGTDIFLLDIASGVQTRLTRTRSDEYNENWFPDGSGLVFTRVRWSQHVDERGIWKVDVATGVTTPMIDAAGIDEGGPTVSPDGTRMAWVRGSPHPDPNLMTLNELMVSDLDGTNAVILDDCVLECSFYNLDWETI